MLESAFWTIASVLGILALVLVVLWILMVLMFFYVAKRYNDETSRLFDDSSWLHLDPDSRNN